MRMSFPQGMAAFASVTRQPLADAKKNTEVVEDLGPAVLHLEQ